MEKLRKNGFVSLVDVIIWQVTKGDGKKTFVYENGWKNEKVKTESGLSGTMI